MLIDNRIYSRIVSKKKELDDLRPLPRPALARMRSQFAIELAYNSNGIEGNSLTLAETRLVIEEGISIKGKPLREVFEALNHQKAFLLLEGFVKKKEHFSERIILDIHRVILSGIDDRYAGRYRDVNVRIPGAVKSPPRFEKVPGLMEEYVEYVNSNPGRLNNLELAAYVHYRFVEIHPFSDGNGRVARLLMNLFLIRHGYPITMILKLDRKKYYDRLKKADLGDMSPFADFIALNVERSLDLYLDAFKTGEDYLSLAEAAKDSDFSQEYLSLLSRKGRIDAVKLGRNWFIKRSSIENYKKTKDK